MTISYVKLSADSVRITLINLVYDIFGPLAKTAYLDSIYEYVLFNKIMFSWYIAENYNVNSLVMP